MGFVTFGTRTFQLERIVTVHDQGNGECVLMLDLPGGETDTTEPRRIVLTGDEGRAAVAFFRRPMSWPPVTVCS